MKPPLMINMDRNLKKTDNDSQNPSSSCGVSGNTMHMTSSNDVRHKTVTSDRNRGSDVSREEVANAAAQLRQLLRKQTLAYQSHIMDVVRSGDVSELNRFLEQTEGKVNVNFFDKEGQTALHQSCLEGNVELVKVLVKYGADTRLANKDGWNPLHVATFSGHKDIVMFLVSLHSR